MTAKPRKPLLVNLTWAGVLVFVFVPVLYVLSYAPAVQWKCGQTGSMTIDGGELPIYQPVDWLIDNTPLERPLLWWAALFGVREEFEFAGVLRTGDG